MTNVVAWLLLQVAYCLCAVCRCTGHELVGPMTLPLGMVRDAPSVQRASSNRSSLSEPITPGTSATTQGMAGPAAGVQDSLAATSLTGSGAGAPMARKLLFEMFAGWCEEGDGEVPCSASPLPFGGHDHDTSTPSDGMLSSTSAPAASVWWFITALVTTCLLGFQSSTRHTWCSNWHPAAR